MKRGVIYTVKEIIEQAGLDYKLVGKQRTIIGGLKVNDAKATVRIPDSAENTLTVQVADDVVELTIE